MMLLQKGASVNLKIRIRCKKAEEPKPGYKPAWKFNPLGWKQRESDIEYPLFQVRILWAVKPFKAIFHNLSYTNSFIHCVNCYIL